jgi:uncharacterized protein YjbJ (UPF0337 family)
MNKEQLEGNWSQLKGKVREQWGKLTDDDIAVVNGRRDQLAGKIEERYGLAKAEVAQQIAQWERRLSDSAQRD